MSAYSRPQGADHTSRKMKELRKEVFEKFIPRESESLEEEEIAVKREETEENNTRMRITYVYVPKLAEDTYTSTSQALAINKQKEPPGKEEVLLQIKKTKESQKDQRSYSLELAGDRDEGKDEEEGKERVEPRVPFRVKKTEEPQRDEGSLPLELAGERGRGKVEGRQRKERVEPVGGVDEGKEGSIFDVDKEAQGKKSSFQISEVAEKQIALLNECQEAAKKIVEWSEYGYKLDFLVTELAHKRRWKQKEEQEVADFKLPTQDDLGKSMTTEDAACWKKTKPTLELIGRLITTRIDMVRSAEDLKELDHYLKEDRIPLPSDCAEVLKVLMNLLPRIEDARLFLDKKAKEALRK